MMSLEQFRPHCETGKHCSVCRDPVLGVRLRKSLGYADGAIFICPFGVPEGGTAADKKDCSSGVETVALVSEELISVTIRGCEGCPHLVDRHKYAVVCNLASRTCGCRGGGLVTVKGTCPLGKWPAASL